MRAGEWPSPLGAAAVAEAGLRLAQPALHDGHAYWLEGRPAERGRVALLRCPLAGGAPEELTPPAASARSRINEYGGGAFLACAAGTFYIDDHDQQVWRIDAPGRASRLTDAPGLRFADLALDASRARLVAVCEDLRDDPHRPSQRLVAIALAPGRDGAGALTELAAGADLYACPRVSPDGATLSFLAWDLPDMPWDGARRWTIDLASGSRTAVLAAGGDAACAFQPGWDARGAAWWADDTSGRFALVRGDGRRFPDGDRECALPLWNLNMRCLAPADGRAPLVASIADGLWQLRELDPARGAWRPLLPELTEVQHLDADPDHALLLAGGADAPLSVIALERATGAARVLRAASALAIAPDDRARAEPVRCPGPGGAVHGLWWAPRSARAALAPDERPPLLVRCHGGPTAAAASALDPRTLFWTTRGFAVLDVNYRGSWGYGREHRAALDGAWGEADAEDAVAAARWAIAAGRADPARIAITGSSAGGFTALNALTLPDQPFASAAVHYGIADLTTAMTDTHRFESGYGERLLGPWPGARAIYEQRSPLNRLARLATPTLLTCGSDDKVVPPDQAERMAAALAARGVRVELRRYAGEGHSFRAATTVADVLAAELAFHAASFGIAWRAEAG
jgi:dipeptidyl aminopeptidase/acylaminoacyl peptidase